MRVMLMSVTRNYDDERRLIEMGVFKRRNKDGEEGETWYVDYRDPTGKRIIKAVGPSKREAQERKHNLLKFK